MSDKTKKIDKEFCWTDASVNCYGYRCLTSGLLLDEIKKNPIGFKMHNRDNGVVVRWEDFRVDGDTVYAKPVINLAHKDGQQTVDEIENCFLNAASAGKIVCLEASDDPKLKLPGQTMPTVTKWFPREISLVDIPGNYNALANLYDQDGNELNLSDFVNPKNENMSKNILLVATMLTALNLKDDATQDDANKAFEDLVAKAEKVDTLTKDLADMTDLRDTLKTENDTLKAAGISKQVEDLIAKGQSEKKVSVALGATLKRDYATNPAGLKDLIDGLTVQPSIAADLKDAKDESEFSGKKWDDLYAANQLETVRTKFPDLYETLRKEKYPKN